MEKVWIDGGELLQEGAIVPNPGLLLAGGHIAGIGALCPEAARRIDARNLLIAPGFIDIHTHGALLHDFSSPTDEGYDAVSGYLAQHGVTAFAPTTLTMPLACILSCLRYAQRAKGRALPGARALGLHLEGPFLSEINRGAHSLRDIAPCRPELYEPLLAYAGCMASMTLSPGSPGAPDMIRAFAAAGVVICGGHDDACEEQIEEAIEAGMTHTTHLFCVMSTMGRRNGKKSLGLTEMTLLDDRLSTEIIADGCHTNASMVRLAYKCKGAQKLCLVSDMLCVGGLPAGDKAYTIAVPGVEGGLSVVVTEGVARLSGSQLNAGSVTALDAMVRNTIACGIPVADALCMASQAPARALGLQDSMGRIRRGYRADLCLLDTDMRVHKTLVGGKVVYDTP